MEQNLTIAVLGGLGTMLGWGFADFSAKKTFNGVSTLGSLVWAHVAGTIIFLIVIITSLLMNYSLELPQSLTSWLLLAIFGILQMIVYWLFYEGLEKGKATLLSPIFASYAGVVALISLSFLGEIATVYKVSALIILFTGIALLNINFNFFKAKKKIRLTAIPGFKYVISATLLASLWLIGWDHVIQGTDWLTNTFFMYAFMTLSAVVIARWRRASLVVSGKNTWMFLFLVGLGEVLAYTMLSFGYSAVYYTSVVTMIAGASALPTIILSRIFLQEKITRIQFLGTLTTIAGVILISQ